MYIADMHHQRVRKGRREDAADHDRGGQRTLGTDRGRGRATDASMAGPAGIAVVPDAAGRLTLYIADYYNGRVRAVGPDGIIRDVGSEGRVTFGAPTRVAYAPRRASLWIADASLDRLVALRIRADTAAAPARRPPPARPAARPVGN